MFCFLKEQKIDESRTGLAPAMKSTSLLAGHDLMLIAFLHHNIDKLNKFRAKTIFPAP
jgi:hypothetical protein